MNLLRSTVAVAVATALGASAAHALDRTEYASATKIYFGGATATDNVLENVLIAADGDSICDPVLGDIDIWRSANQRVITCRVSNDHPVTAGRGFATRTAGGTMIAFHKESAGGSSNGVNPLINVARGQAHSLRWLDVSQLTNDCTTSAAGGGNLLTYTNHDACSNTALTAVDTAGSAAFDVHGGISDNEPALAYPAPGADAARLTVVPGIQIVFGVPVTTALYRALQVAQFGDGSACDGSDAQNCVPSLDKNQIAALYTQQVFDWNNFVDDNGTSLPAAAGVTPPADEFVRICRRVATSGTQASFEAVLLNARCVNGVQGFALPDDSSTIDDTVYSPSQFAAGSLVNAGPSSTNVRTCLAAAHSGNFWGVGVLSTEVSDSNYNNGNAGFRFVAIDGAAPNLANVANGTYDFYSENTVNYISSAPGNQGALPAGDNRLDIVQLVSNRLGNLDALNTINASFDGRPWGNGGVLALPTTPTTNTAPYTAAELANEPVGTQTRNGNTCQPSLMADPQPLAR